MFWVVVVSFFEMFFNLTFLIQVKRGNIVAWQCSSYMKTRCGQVPPENASKYRAILGTASCILKFTVGSGGRDTDRIRPIGPLPPC